MKKPLGSLVFSLMLALVLMLPSMGLAEIGNSANIKKDLPVEKLTNMELSATGVNVEFKMLDKAEDAPYAELDATVVGIDSANIQYGLEVNETDTGVQIVVNHGDGTVIGINRVSLYIFVQKDTTIESLALTMHDSDLTANEVNIQNVSGNLADSKIHAGKATIGMIDLTTNTSDLNLEGAISGLKLQATGGTVKMATSVVPSEITVNATETTVEIKVPETAEGFVLNYDLTESEFKTDHASEYEENAGTVTVGNGASPFTFNITNGKLHLNK